MPSVNWHRFVRTTIASFLVLWVIAIGGFLWLATETMPTPVAYVYDLLFIKLFNVPGLVLLSTILPESLGQSPVGFLFVFSFGYLLVSLAIATVAQAIRWGYRVWRP